MRLAPFFSTPFASGDLCTNRVVLAVLAAAIVAPIVFYFTVSPSTVLHFPPVLLFALIYGFPISLVATVIALPVVLYVGRILGFSPALAVFSGALGGPGVGLIVVGWTGKPKDIAVVFAAILAGLFAGSVAGLIGIDTKKLGSR